MPSLVPNYEYDIFISYRHNDNLDLWVTNFVHSLEKELKATLKEAVTIYFDKNPQDGLLETHIVGKSLEGKLKCLVFIPIISQTYADTRSFAWQYEFCAFNKLAKEEPFGRDIKLLSGNVGCRILPVKIHDLDKADVALLEKEMGSALRSIEFIFKSPGVNRPLRADEDHPQDNLNKTYYRDQVNKVANAIKEIIFSLNSEGRHTTPSNHINSTRPLVTPMSRTILFRAAMVLAGTLLIAFAYVKWFQKGSQASGKKSLAVIPFKLIGNDQEGKYFAEGVADALINHLHSIQDIEVRSRTSVEKYANSGKTIPEIGEELNVGYILEGSAQKYKDDIRIIVQLINTQNDEHIWFKEYNEKFDNIFKIQSEIALNIVSELNVKLASAQKQRVQKIPTQSSEAWDLYLRGKEYARNYWKYRENADRIIAIDFYKKAIQKDPEFAMAYLRLGEASAGTLSGDAASHLKVSKVEAGIVSGDSNLFFIQKALELDPDLPDAYEFLGNAIVQTDFEKGVNYIQKAVQMDSLQTFLYSLGRAHRYKKDRLKALYYFNMALKKEQSESYQWLLCETGWCYMAIGELELGEKYTDRALAFEPDNQSFLNQKWYIQILRGNYEAVLEAVTRSIAVRNNDMGLLKLATVYMLQGNFEKSASAYEQFFSLPKDKTYFSNYEKVNYAYVLRKLGREKEAMANVLEGRDFLEKTFSDPNHHLARAFVFLGQKDKAIATLTNWAPTYAGGIPTWIDKDPMFADIKENPRFKQLLVQFNAQIEKNIEQAEIGRVKGELPTLEPIGKY